MRDPLLYYRNITENTIILLSGMEKANVHHIVYSSSCTTYGAVKLADMPIKEEMYQKPETNYGRAKLMSEQTILSWVSKGSLSCATILRYFNAVGSDANLRLGEIPAV